MMKEVHLQDVNWNDPPSPDDAVKAVMDSDEMLFRYKARLDTTAPTSLEVRQRRHQDIDRNPIPSLDQYLGYPVSESASQRNSNDGS
jgi:hypothetical protein